MLNSIYIGYVAKTHGLNGMFTIKLVGTKYVGNKWVDVKLDYSLKFYAITHRISKLQKK